MNTKKAFTLAEVLITLGIIGVVAALTIPTLMQRTQDREAISALKKFYSTLSSAYN
ncbi:type II secretion system protein, partial [bacterium]|nr:type II secretion system protein [bacterium]